MSDDLITLWRYRDLPEALIAHSKLKSERFDCFLADDNMVRFDWYWSNMLGGVRLRARKDDAESALEVLGEDIPERFSAEEVGEEYEQPHARNASRATWVLKSSTERRRWWLCTSGFRSQFLKTDGIVKIAEMNGKASTSRS